MNETWTARAIHAFLDAYPKAWQVGDAEALVMDWLWRRCERGKR